MNKLESAVQAEIVAYLVKHDVMHVKLKAQGLRGKNGARMPNPLKGWPEILYVIPNTNGKIAFHEIKTPDGEFSDDQKAVIKELRNRDVLVSVGGLKELQYFVKPHLRTP